MLDHDAVDAVMFDMGGVFVVPHWQPMGEAIRATGLDIRPNESDTFRAHYFGIRAITERLAHGEVMESDTTIWDHYDRAYFSSLGVHDDYLEGVAAARDAQRRNGIQSIWRQRLKANIAAFARIALDRRVAIVSNNDGTAIEQCLEFGICQLGDGPLTSVTAIVDSGSVGVAKPDPRIFDPAIAALGTERSRTLYVGDTVHADVLGATAAGIGIVQLDPFDLHDDHDHWRMPDVAALADHLAG